MDDHGQAGGHTATGTHASLWLETTPETDAVRKGGEYLLNQFHSAGVS